jgi:Glucose / Sorbosone dehydrogenase
MRRLIATAALFGAIAPAAHGQYAIPVDNPFVNTPGAREEVYVYGMRNPFRWSFDRQTGDMIVGDVGGTQEEITFLPRANIAGANLGWNCFSGTSSGPGGCDPPNDVPPAHTFPSSGPGSGVVIGGYMVRDPSLPGFQGRYIYGDFTNGDLYWLGPGATGTRQDTGVDVQQVSGFGEDGAGHLYVTSLAGPVFRLGQSGSALTATSVGTFTQPVAVAAPPGNTDRLFIIEKPGLVKLRTGTAVTDFLNITSLVGDVGGEEGLLAFAVSPDYATSGRVFAFYTDNAGDLQLDEFVRTASGPDRSEPSTRKPVLTIPHRQGSPPADNHNGGQLLFGPDNYLYLSTGDGGVQGDPEDDAQNLGSLLGKILRVDLGVAGVPGLPVGGAGAAGGGVAGGVSALVDTTGPRLTARVKRRQRVLRLRGAVAYLRCDEPCSLSARGHLRIGRRSYRMRPAAGAAQAGRRTRMKVGLTRTGRRGLRRALRRGRRPVVRLGLQARDAVGNPSPLVRRTVRVRR